MLEKVHQHIVSELRQSARTDTIFVVTKVTSNRVRFCVSETNRRLPSLRPSTLAAPANVAIPVAAVAFVRVPTLYPCAGIYTRAVG